MRPKTGAGTYPKTGGTCRVHPRAMLRVLHLVIRVSLWLEARGERCGRDEGRGAGKRELRKQSRRGSKEGSGEFGAEADQLRLFSGHYATGLLWDGKSDLDARLPKARAKQV
eukprot:562082-Pleurochrysis_carterae.AAC.3